MLRPPQHQVESACQKEAEALLQSPGQQSREAVFLYTRARGGGQAARPSCRPLTLRVGPYPAGPTAPHMALPQSTSPSSGSVSGSSSRGRGFNNCSSCSARGCGPAIVTSLGSAHVNVRPPPGRGRSLPGGYSRPETTYSSGESGTARSCVPSSRQATSGRLAGGGGACGVSSGLARMKAEVPGRLNRLSRSRPVCACVERVSEAARERARGCG